MRRTMNIPEETATGTKADFVPAQTHPDFAKNFQRILPELRYGEPGYNPYVYRPGDHQSRLPQLREKMEKVRGFQQRLEGIAANENPFEGLALYAREGIAAQLEFREQFREWQKLHTELKARPRSAPREQQRARLRGHRCHPGHREVGPALHAHPARTASTPGRATPSTPTASSTHVVFKTAHPRVRPQHRPAPQLLRQRRSRLHPARRDLRLRDGLRRAVGRGHHAPHLGPLRRARA
jgi:hypothetical protein